MLPLTKIPCLEAPPIPPKKLKGIEITRAHGHDTTKNDKALYIHIENVVFFMIRGGIIANSNAIITTVGVYMAANFVIKFSDLDFLLLAFSTNSRILLTVDSSYSLDT